MTDKNDGNGGFSEGRLTYTVEEMGAEKAAQILGEAWEDGYLAFSNREVRLAAISREDRGKLSEGRIWENQLALGGYLMEAGLWRVDKDSGNIVEACLEREDGRFLLQRWELAMEADEAVNCHWRLHKNLPTRTDLAFQNGIDAVEVIVPEKRLHFFITRTVRANP